MKRHLYPILCCVLFWVAAATCSQGVTNTPPTYVIPIHGMIERGLLYVIRRGVEEAQLQEARAIIFDMDTPGGRVDVTEEIIRTLIDLPDSIETYTFINKDALSAGAMIAIATKQIYMAPGSRIGASAIVTAQGDLEEGDLKEKHVSSLVALVRNAAERNGHDPQLIESMIRKDMEYTIGSNVVCKAGQLLTLTDRDAAKRVTRENVEAPLLSAGTVKTLDALYTHLSIDKRDVRTIAITGAERVARFIELFAFVFLAGGLLGIYIEFKTPGFGIPGIAGAVLLAIFFWGHHVAGLTGGMELVIFATGVMLLALELFVIPGFGAAGISGLFLILLSVFMAMVEHYPGTQWFKLAPIQLEGAFTNLGLALAMTLGLGLVVARILPKTSAFQHLMLTTALDQAHGVSASAPTNDLVGAKGRAVTQLHPAGFGTINGKRVNVVARGAFIDEGMPIVVAEAHGNRIVVDVDRTESTDAKQQKSSTPA
ncbi:MAG: nodulation protein NfeD [Verrucomicrobia bacterium]|jgi:membrane-bound serine protease (ClpP class)|nr:nodulation protein NfeD [Verrucomicrobiota bacterium]